MKSFVNISFWTSNNARDDIDASIAYIFGSYYYDGFFVCHKNCKYISVRNFYKLWIK